MFEKHWIALSIPCWRRVLQESLREHDAQRENYARWMLGAVLEDLEYKGIWLPPDKFQVEAEKLTKALTSEETSPHLPGWMI